MTQSTTQSKLFYPSTHAAEQAQIRFGVNSADVHAWLQQQVAQAELVRTTPDGKRNIYESLDVRIIASADEATTISVTPLQSALPVHAKVRQLVERQLRVAEARHSRDSRALRIEHAELGVEAARLALNLERAKSPVAQSQINVKQHALADRIKDVELRQLRVDETLETERRAARMYGVTGA